MLATMYQAPGIGLAATQVNVHLRLIVCDTSEDQQSPHIFINPRLVEGEGRVETQEGCLSVPGFYERVFRHEKILVEAVDQNGDVFQLGADGLLAICIQHEMDHLDGSFGALIRFKNTVELSPIFEGISRSGFNTRIEKSLRYIASP